MGWKLVRDNTEAVARAHGCDGTWREAGPGEIVPALTAKLFEELGEFVQEDYDPAELYDLQDVIGELMARLDPRGDAFNRYIDKVSVRGKFKRGIMWHPLPGAGKDAP